MYKYLLCSRYLKTRYIALASIISVTLGVATMIVVNSVMAGFSNEMHKRLHGILSDLVFESFGLDGLPNPDAHMAEIEKVLGDDLAGMTATVRTPAMMLFQHHGRYIPQQVVVVGIDDETYANVSDFSPYLMHEKNRQKLSFDLHEGGYDERLGRDAGWDYRRRIAQIMKEMPAEPNAYLPADTQFAPNAGDEPVGEAIPNDPFGGQKATPFGAEEPQQVAAEFDEGAEQHTGVILGVALASTKMRNPETNKVEEIFLKRPGDNVQLVLPSTGTPPKPIQGTFTVTDFYESKMSEYDSTLVFMPLSKLQEMRGMIDPITGVAAVTSIQIKLRDGADLNGCRDKLQAAFPSDRYPYRVQSWRDMQGPLLAAVKMETMILNILLFLIIAVAGFGILATFFMIVVEKTKDIGILKSLGAPSTGVMSIFLSYGIALGAVGSGVGIILGLLFVININRIAAVIEIITGQEVFDPTVYYFQQIPTIIDPVTIVWVAIGAVFIAVLASVLPALRAARLHPVEALRYE